MSMDYQIDKEFALEMDRSDPLAKFRDRFFIPKQDNGEDSIYLCGNSLGLMPKSAREFVEIELQDWERLAVKGHFHGRNPWKYYHEMLPEKTSKIVGALPGEVTCMNGLSVNLNLMLVSFYRPTSSRYKILVENGPFPSDRYAVDAQIRFHGYDPASALVELRTRPGEETLRTEDILEFIQREGDSIALIMLGGVNYYTGQFFDLNAITQAGHKNGCAVGFDIAHAAGNVVMNLHDWDVDFAVWCTYKYMNAGPGGVAGCFVHERFAKAFDLPRFKGWWSNESATRFQMRPECVLSQGAEGWQISNPPIFQMAALRASTDIFDEVGMSAIRAKSEKITGYLEFLIGRLENTNVKVITPRNPAERGAQLSLKFPGRGKELLNALLSSGVVCDYRDPDVIRIAPAPLYNKYMDVFRFTEILAGKPWPEKPTKK